MSIQNKKSMEKVCYRRKDVAKMFGLSEKTVDRKIRGGFIKAIKNGHMVLILSDSVSIENLFAPKPKFNNEI